MILVAFAQVCGGEVGITPEQIYSPHIDFKQLIDTWEVLPSDDPLSEKPNLKRNSSQRILMTLRKDGTCRIFNEDHPNGSDGLWTYENHRMQIKFPSGSSIEYFIYGVRGDYMVTHVSGKDGRHQLWSRVK